MYPEEMESVVHIWLESLVSSWAKGPCAIIPVTRKLFLANVKGRIHFEMIATRVDTKKE